MYDIFVNILTIYDLYDSINKLFFSQKSFKLTINWHLATGKPSYVMKQGFTVGYFFYSKQPMQAYYLLFPDTNIMQCYKYTVVKNIVIVLTARRCCDMTMHMQHNNLYSNCISGNSFTWKTTKRFLVIHFCSVYRQCVQPLCYTSLCLSYLKWLKVHFCLLVVSIRSILCNVGIITLTASW